MSNYGEIIGKAKQTRKEDNQKESKPEKMVNLCVKVPESLRRHWAAEAKRQGITMTQVITKALNKKFGTPED